MQAYSSRSAVSAFCSEDSLVLPLSGVPPSSAAVACGADHLVAFLVPRVWPSQHMTVIDHARAPT